MADQTKAQRDRIATALARFRVAAEAEQDQRDQELDDLRFVDLQDQWPAEEKEKRKAGLVGGIPIPARPCLVVDKLSQPIRQVINQARTARLGIQITPDDEHADEPTAEIIQGIIRKIEVASRAQIARMWAFARAVKCGRGYYRILKAYANDGDDDLDLVVKRILNQHSVYLDPFHQEPDGSDAEWAFIVEDMPFDRYKREFPTSKLAKYGEAQLNDLAGTGDDAPSWVGGEKDSRTVRVAEYFYCTYDSAKRTSGAEYQKRSIKWCKINAVEVLEEEDWEGRFIPIVQVLGEEVNVNGERVYKGIVRPAKDSQRMKNYMASSKAETIGLATKSPWVAAEGQFEGYEKQMLLANQRNFPYIYYKPKVFGGALAPAPQRNVAEPAIQAIVMAERDADNDLQALTGGYDPSLGKADSASQSGRAIQALQQQSEHGNSNYLQDFADVSMIHEANILLDMIPYVYDRPGRRVKILEGDNDQSRQIILGQPFTNGPKGMAQPMPDGQQPQAPQQPGMVPPKVEHYDLTQGRYGVTVNIGKAFTTRKQEASAMLGELAQAAPQTVPAWMDIWIRNMDIPGGTEIAERVTPPQFKKGADGQAPNPEVAQLQQQLQILTQQLQEAQSGIAAKQIQAQSNEKIAAAKIEHEQQIAQLKADVDKLKIAAGIQTKQAEIQQRGQQTMVDAAISERQHARDMAHEQASQVMEFAHQHATHGAQLQHDSEMAQTSHIHAKDLQASAPKPKPAGQ